LNGLVHDFIIGEKEQIFRADERKYHGWVFQSAESLTPFGNAPVKPETNSPKPIALTHPWPLPIIFKKQSQ
jgi:hypothetical protein